VKHIPYFAPEGYCGKAKPAAVLLLHNIRLKAEMVDKPENARLMRRIWLYNAANKLFFK